MQFLFGAFLAAISGALAKRILIALGFSVVTYTGFQSIKSAVGSAITSYLGEIPSSIYQVLALAGFVDAIGIWLGAFTVAVALMTVKRFALL